MAENRNDSTSGDENAAVFQPDTVLPSQFFATLRQKGYVEGEKRLVAAVLADAVECYMKQAGATDPCSRQVFREAEQWIFGETPGWFFSFPSVCDVLGLDAQYVRRGLEEWREKREALFRPHEAIRQGASTDAAELPVPKKATG